MSGAIGVTEAGAGEGSCITELDCSPKAGVIVTLLEHFEHLDPLFALIVYVSLV